MMPHFKTQTRTTHVMRSRLHTPPCRSWRFSLGYRLIPVLIALGVGGIVLLVTECSGQMPPNVEEKTSLEEHGIARGNLADNLAGTKRPEVTNYS